MLDNSTHRWLTLGFFVALLGTALIACPPPVTGPGGSGNDDDGGGDDDSSGTPSASDATQSPSESSSPTPSTILETCAVTGDREFITNGTLSCADEVGELRWDFYIFPVAAGDCIDIFTDNQGEGNADLLAAAFDANQRSYFGLQDDYSQLDDEWACTNTPWFAGAGCPERAVVAATSGDFTVAVAQWAGGCANGMSDYQISVAVNGVDLDLSTATVIDETPLE